MWLVEGLGRTDSPSFPRRTTPCSTGFSGSTRDGADGHRAVVHASDAPPAWKPRKAPAVSELLVQSVREQVSHPLRMAREALEPNSEALKVLWPALSGLKPLLAWSRWDGAAVAESTCRSAAPAFEMVELSLAEVKQVRARTADGDDVILATVAGALRTWLTDRGERRSQTCARWSR